MKFSNICVAALAGLLVASPAMAETTPERLVRAAKCEAVLVSQVKLYRALSTFLTGSAPVLLDSQTRRSAQALSEGYDRFGEATLRRAAALDAHAEALAGEKGFTVYKRVVNAQAGVYLKSAADAAMGILPSPSTIEEMSKEAMVCNDWIDTEIAPGQAN